MRVIGWATAVLFALAFLASFRMALQSGEVVSQERFANSHSDIACIDCHALRAETSSVAPSMAEQSSRCIKCHRPLAENASGVPLNFHLGRDKTCLDCHSFHRQEQIRTGNQQFRVCFENTFQRTQCYSCHGPAEDVRHLSEAHRGAASIFHSDVGLVGQLSPSQACLCCHSETPKAERPGTDANFSQAPRFDEHGSHPVGVSVMTGRGAPGNRIRAELDSRIQLFNGRIECQTCHSLSGGNAHSLIDVSDRSELCRGCHQID